MRINNAVRLGAIEDNCPHIAEWEEEWTTSLDETQASCSLLLSTFTSFAHEINAEQPEVLVTDFDRALKEAANEHLPFTQQQICVFHINKNVIMNIKHKWQKPKQAPLTTRNFRHGKHRLSAFISQAIAIAILPFKFNHNQHTIVGGQSEI